MLWLRQRQIGSKIRRHVGGFASRVVVVVVVVRAAGGDGDRRNLHSEASVVSEKEEVIREAQRGVLNVWTNLKTLNCVTEGAFCFVESSELESLLLEDESDASSESEESLESEPLLFELLAGFWLILSAINGNAKDGSRFDGGSLTFKTFTSYRLCHGLAVFGSFGSACRLPFE